MADVLFFRFVVTDSGDNSPIDAQMRLLEDEALNAYAETYAIAKARRHAISIGAPVTSIDVLKHFN